MRYLTFIAAFALFVISCNTGNTPPARPDTGLPKSYFEGKWVRTDYYEAIIKTRSPYMSRNKLEGVATIMIDTGKIKGDSLIAGASWNNHEGYEFTLYSMQGHNAASFFTCLPDYNNHLGHYELGYKKIGNDTFLVLYHLNNHNELTDSIKYMKTRSKNIADPTSPIQYTVNQLLFAGSYILYDSAGHEGQLRLNSDGKVNGTIGYTDYYVPTDFNGGPETGDYIILSSITDESDTKSRCFAFTNTADSIKLFATTEDSTGEITNGKLAYILKKKQ